MLRVLAKVKAFGSIDYSQDAELAMQMPFSTQPELFVTSADLERPSLQGLDEAEVVLGWGKLEHLLIGIYASKTGRPSHPC